ncbi:MAG TPA: glycogen/starch synthase, partial [Candidatus Brocadiia bacterium]|nr:glycogen/starch synthase [Candidatus Brocadiia bacterium]
YGDNCKRFAFLSRAAIETLRVLDEPFDVLHLHDWQTALAAAYQRILYWNDAAANRPATVLTVHNIFHQGAFWHLDMPMLGLDWSHFNANELEMNGKISLLKAGLVFADAINAVSPTYARDIQTPEGGFGLDGVLRNRVGRVFGIVNGLDYEEWDPATDPAIAQRYSAADMAGKAECKRALQRECNLPVGDAPLVAVISRLDKQKGLDILAAAFPGLMAKGVQFVLLGTGEWWCHFHFPDLQRQYPSQASIHLKFDNALAHRIQAGADMVLMPSLFEPCGLVQLAAQRYGTVPVARRVGGLGDTIVDATPDRLASGAATGFLFNDYTPDALLWAMDQALAAYRDKTAWRRLQAAGMRADWSWRSSALHYVDLFQQAVAFRAQR